MRGFILVIDDDADTRDAVVEMLELEGFRAASARSGAHALRLLESPEKPVAILVNVHMPVMDGVELCRAFNTMPELDTVPRILTTGTEPARLEECRAHGYLRKPIRRPELLKVLSTALH